MHILGYAARQAPKNANVLNSRKNDHPKKCLALETRPKSHEIFRGEGVRTYFFKAAFCLSVTWYITLFVSKDCCNAGAGVQLIGTAAFFITQSLHIANNRPLLCAEFLWTLWRQPHYTV